MAPDGSPYPPMPGDKHFAESFDGKPLHPRYHTSRLIRAPETQLHKVESPDYDVKDESESPTNIQYMKRYSQVVKVSNSSPIATTQKLEHFNLNTADIAHIPTRNDYQLPTYNTGSRPFSYPVGSTSGYPHPVNNLSQAQSRPYSYAGTANQPYRIQYVPPTATTAGSIQLPPQIRPFNPYTAAFAPWPAVPPAPLQDLPDASVKDKVEDQDSVEEDDSDPNEGFTPDADSYQSVENTEEELMLPGSRRKPDQWPDTIFDFDGYPDHDQDPPADLSCYEVCQRYPASIMNDNLLPFIQRRWSADEIFHCLPLDVQQYLHDREFKQVTNYLFKRLQKLEFKLRGLGPSGKTGTRNLTAYLALLNGPRMRDDGRPADVRKNQSAAAPNRAWRKRKDVGIDPDTGFYVEIASQPQARFRALMEAAPADALASQVAAPNQAPHLRPLPNPLRLRKDRRKARPRGGSRHTTTPAPANTPLGGPYHRSVSSNLPTNADPAPTHTHQNPAPAWGTVGQAPYGLPQAARTTTPRQPFVDNLSETRSPTLASMFPDGMINLRGAYVRVVSPRGTSMWHGAPSAEFIENYTRERGHQFWMDVNLPQQYDANAPYPSLLAANEPATVRTGLADWLDLNDFDLPHEKEAKLAAEREARLKRTAEEMSDEVDEEVYERVKKARTDAGAVETTTEQVPDEATQAIMEIMDPDSPEKTPERGFETADSLAEEANEANDLSPGEEPTDEDWVEVAAQDTANEDAAES